MRFRLGAAALLALTASLFTPAVAEEEAWDSLRTAGERGDVSTWVRTVPGFSIKAFRGVVEVPHALPTVMAVLTDVPNFPSWVFQCHAAEQNEAWGPEHTRVMIKGIWPVSDRDVLVRSRVEQDPQTYAITLYSNAAEGVLAPQEGYVRLPALNNLFRLEPLDDGWTRVTFQTFVDPGGAIPAWLSNFVSTRAPLTTLRGMKKQMALERYQVASLDELDIDLPGFAELRVPPAHGGAAE